MSGRRLACSLGASTLLLAVLLPFNNCGVSPRGSLSRSSSALTTSQFAFIDSGPGINYPEAIPFVFSSNQLAAHETYKPGPVNDVINGQLEEAFGVFERWSGLGERLRGSGGAFGVHGLQIGRSTSAFLESVRAKGILISADTPLWTQIRDGHELALAELFGIPELPSDRDPFNRFLTLDPSVSGRTDPIQNGLFVTRDGKNFVPDELVLDERIPGMLVPLDRTERGDPIEALAQPGTWEERKRRARQVSHDAWAAVDTFNAGVSRLRGGMNDYLEYARVLRRKWPQNTPLFSFHWNLHPGWEWRDEACWDEQVRLAASRGEADPYLGPETLRELRRPCYNSARYLVELIQALCLEGTCPHAVYMDMDLGYQPKWSLEMLRRHKQSLRAIPLADGRMVSVAMGINLVDVCNTDEFGWNCVVELQNGRLISTRREGVSSNLLYQESILTVLKYLISEGIVDATTPVRFMNWMPRPRERDEQVHEGVAGSMAHSALRIMDEILVPRGFLNLSANPSPQPSSSSTSSPMPAAEDSISGSLDLVDVSVAGIYVSGSARSSLGQSVRLDFYVDGRYHSRQELTSAQSGFQAAITGLAAGAHEVAVYGYNPGLPSPRIVLIGNSSVQVPSRGNFSRLLSNRLLAASTLYIADNGIYAEYLGHRCAFADPASFEEITRRSSIAGIPRRGHLPWLIDDGHCLMIPDEDFIIHGSGVHLIRGKSHCGVPSWSDFVRLSGRNSLEGIPTFRTSPGLRYTGTCAE